MKTPASVEASGLFRRQSGVLFDHLDEADPWRLALRPVTQLARQD
jgi:hypothetical protein